MRSPRTPRREEFQGVLQRSALVLTEGAIIERVRRQWIHLLDDHLDFLVASTLPALQEARGMAIALEETGLPYFLSFVIRREGQLLDGTGLGQAIDFIDGASARPPLGYLVNCVHPDNFEEALRVESAAHPALFQRVIGLQANASRQSPEELDGRPDLDSGEPRSFGAAMGRLHFRWGMRILGGCCGTDDRHLHALAEACTQGEIV